MAHHPFAKSNHHLVSTKGNTATQNNGPLGPDGGRSVDEETRRKKAVHNKFNC